MMYLKHIKYRQFLTIEKTEFNIRRVRLLQLLS